MWLKRRTGKDKRHHCPFPWFNFFNLRFAEGAVWKCDICLATYRARKVVKRDSSDSYWDWERV